MLNTLAGPEDRVTTAHRAKLAYIYVRVEVIDDDLGKSGTSSKGRGGFQRLIAEIGLGKAGLVLSLDASRLTRNNHDWHPVWRSDRRWRAAI